MSNRERMREETAALPTAEVLDQRTHEGWRLVALEWERGTGERGTGERGGALLVEAPFGLRVATDCRTLEEEPRESQALGLMLAMIDADQPLSQVAERLNERGYRQRGGEPWTQVAVFYQLPRLVEAAPGLRRRAA
jgi:hypothetical protein